MITIKLDLFIYAKDLLEKPKDNVKKILQIVSIQHKGIKFHQDKSVETEMGAVFVLKRFFSDHPLH